MSLWVIIPVKPLRRSKSRLSNVLTEDERTLLNFNMLENTLGILKGIKNIDAIFVISRDPRALTLARTYGAKTIQEDGEPGLNLALKRAVVIAKTYSVQSILLLPADIPLITESEVKSIINKLSTSPMMVISPDRHMNGTNILLVSPIDLIEFSFGPGSFERHVRQAQMKNATIEVLQLSSTALDIDSPEDLALYQKTLTFQSDGLVEIDTKKGVGNV
ncbi:MAG: 2-phospho-L-lactate guanylyltransferase [Chloroflexi bacterium 44-23]|nr:MAG: 2-phospho-L-lactate guanylyltransferase [Chloroflexi bacterium 44-23]